MMVDPAWWRRVIKPWLAQEVALIHAHDMKVLFHSCGAVRPILSDLIDMGVDALEVFQINAAGMEPRSIAKEFGGRLAFYGGIEVQHLLSSGTREEVAAQVRYNIDCFRECGGYIVSNCHSHIRTIKGENIVAMCEAAQSSGSLGLLVAIYQVQSCAAGSGGKYKRLSHRGHNAVGDCGSAGRRVCRPR